MDKRIAYISHESALAFYESITGSIDHTYRASDVRMPRNSACVPKHLRELSIPRSAIVHNKLHVLVENAGKRTKSPYVQCHVSSQVLARGSFRSIADRVFVSSPEFVFLQMAPKLEMIKLIELGDELCGTFARNPPTGSNDERAPITSIARLRAYATRSENRRGAAKARAALEYVIEGARSPMEIVLVMLLSLPKKLGGYGLPIPELNHRIGLTPAEQRQSGRGYFRCDMYYSEAKYALEYYGADHHTGRNQVAYDSRRLDIIQSRGIQVDVVTFEQLRSLDELNALAKRIRNKLGIESRKPSGRQTALRQHLHALLLPRCHDWDTYA